jgi:hypothetical protein
MNIQLNLFNPNPVDTNFHKNITQHDYKLEYIDIGDITFAEGQQ